MTLDPELTASVQRARLQQLLEHLMDETPTSALGHAMLGVAIGLQLARQHPEVAAAILVTLDPPKFSTVLRWVAYGSTQPDPDEVTH